MIFWLDAQLSPYQVPWTRDTIGIEATAVRELDLLEATDREIFSAARDAGAMLVTKDTDFLDLVERLGPPPQVLLVTCGNTSNEHLRGLLTRALPEIVKLFDKR